MRYAWRSELSAVNLTPGSQGVTTSINGALVGNFRGMAKEMGTPKELKPLVIP
jgi:hypothetical protein